MHFISCPKTQPGRMEALRDGLQLPLQLPARSLEGLDGSLGKRNPGCFTFWKGFNLNEQKKTVDYLLGRMIKNRC